MARGTLTAQTLARHGATGLTGVTWTAAVAADDHQFVNDGNCILLVKNEDAAANTVTVASVADSFGRTGDTAVAVAGKGAAVATIGVIGPFPPALFNQSDGYVYVNVTTETNLSFALIKFSRE